jgi:hypothetical protein
MFLKAVLMAAAAATLALAQGSMAGGGGGRGEQNAGAVPTSNMRVQKETKAQQIVGKLKLSKDQQTEVESILEVSYQEAAPVRDLMSKGRVAYVNAVLSGQSADDMAKLTKDFTTVEAQMANVEVKAFQKIYALLKPNQTAHAPEAFDLMAGIFDAAAGGRGGGRGRGGR